MFNFYTLLRKSRYPAFHALILTNLFQVRAGRSGHATWPGASAGWTNTRRGIQEHVAHCSFNSNSYFRSKVWSCFVRGVLSLLGSSPFKNVREKKLLVKHDAHVFRGNTLGLPKICPEENIGAIDRQTLYTYLSAFHRYRCMVHQIRDYRFIDTDSASGLLLPPCWVARWWVVCCCHLGN